MTDPLAIVTISGLIIGGPCWLDITADTVPPVITDLAALPWRQYEDGDGATWWRSMPTLEDGEFVAVQAPCVVDMIATWSAAPGYGMPGECIGHCSCGPAQTLTPMECGRAVLIYTGPADQTCDGVLDSRDVLQMLRWHVLGVDYNEDGKVDSGDVLDYLAAYAEASSE